MRLSVDTHTLHCQAIDEMHDRQIVGTALFTQAVGVRVTLLTKDQNITNSGLVPTLW